jgi:putative DNA methylase
LSNSASFTKKLIEVALPLEAINEASAREKSIRQGHPSTLHNWWARRPLAACRAVIFASLVDDPSNNYPEERASKERERLFKIIEKMVLWDSTNNEEIFRIAQKEIEKSIDSKIPTLLDPFCGAGSIPLEAERLGLPVCASDLNPVAVLITKALVEIPTRFQPKRPANPDTLKAESHEDLNKIGDILASDVEYYGAKVRDEAREQIGRFYPKVNGHDVIAWIWARTIKCPNPACGFELPLLRSLKLGETRGQIFSIEPIFNGREKTIDFEVKKGSQDPPEGSVHRKGIRCFHCKDPIPFTYAKSEGQAGRITYKPVAMIVEGDRQSSYLPATKDHFETARSARPYWAPESDLPNNTRDFHVQAYGMRKFSDLFTPRQLLALDTFGDASVKIHDQVEADAKAAGFGNDNRSYSEGGKGPKAYADAILTYLALAVDRCSNYWSTFTPWGGSFIVQTFGRQVLPIVWDFAEGNPFSDRTGNWMGAIEWISQCLRQSVPSVATGTVTQLDAASGPFPASNTIVCTDPPYYNNIGYADLSDYFYVWLRRIMSKIHPALFSTMLTPKASELVAASYRFDGDQRAADDHFLRGLEKSFKLMWEKSSTFPMTVFYAFKEAEETKNEFDEESFASRGWATMLQGLISSGFQINGTWPMRTERPQGLKTGTNVLASSIILVCRPRPKDSPPATRREFISALRQELPESLKKLRNSNIAPVDLAQASIGPGMAVFSRYSRVLEATSSQMSVRTALQIINQELDAFLDAQETELDAETRFCIAWFEQHGNDRGLFGDADVLARAKNTSVATLSNLGLLDAAGGYVRIVKRDDLRKENDLSRIERLTIWRCAQELIRGLEDGGERKAATIVNQIGTGLSETSKDLAYRMFSICEKKGMSNEALSYNNLVTSWHSIREKAGLSAIPSGQMKLEV